MTPTGTRSSPRSKQLRSPLTDMRVIGERCVSVEAFIPGAGARHARLALETYERFRQAEADREAWLASLTSDQRRVYDDQTFAAMEAAELDELYSYDGGQ